MRSATQNGGARTRFASSWLDPMPSPIRWGSSIGDRPEIQ
jgi:hypothetical protein